MSRGTNLRPVKSRKHRSHKSYVQLRARNQWKDWQGWNWANAKKKGFELFSRKKVVLLLVVLAVSIGLAAMYADPNNGLFHSYQTSAWDPNTVLWQATAQGNNNAEFNTVGFGTSFSTTTFDGCTGCKVIGMTGNSTSSTLALSKTPTDLSSVSSKELLLNFEFYTPSPSLADGSFGMYITPNKNLPLITSGYDPTLDANVTLVLRMQKSGTTYTINLFVQRKAGETISSEHVGSCGTTGSCMIGLTFSNIAPQSFIEKQQVWLNYTGNSGQTACSGGFGGNGCNVIQQTEWQAGFGVLSSSANTQFPTLSLVSNYYIGYYVQAGETSQVNYLYDDGAHNPGGGQGTQSSEVDVAVPTSAAPTPPPPTVDTGGVFGPLIRALINIGVFMLQEILSFISFIAPAIETAFQFLVSIYIVVFNLIGNFFGLGNIGTNIATLISQFVTFFGDSTKGFPAIMNNLGSLFARFFDFNNIYFSWIPTAFNIAASLLTLGINGIVYGLVIIKQSFLTISMTYAIVLLSLFLVYTGDDALGGILGFLETFQWLIFGTIGWLAKILNFGLDIITALMGFVPKPFIQMIATRVPRLPVVETSARFVNPSFDMTELRRGNMLAIWCWFIDFTFLCWFNSVIPPLPGSIGAAIALPSTFQSTLAGFLPVLESSLIIISALAFIIWPTVKMLNMIGMDLGISDNFGIAPGRRLNTATIGKLSLKKGKKRLQHFAASVERRKGREAKTVTQIELEDLQRQKREAKTIEEVKAAQAKDEAVRKRELEANARRSKDLKRVRLGPLGSEDEK